MAMIELNQSARHLRGSAPLPVDDACQGLPVDESGAVALARELADLPRSVRCAQCLERLVSVVDPLL